MIQNWLEQKIINYLCNQNVLFGIKKSRFVKEQEAKGLLNNLGIKTPLSKIPLLNILSVQMNEIVNKFLLVGDKFMPEMHLKQSGFTYSACGPFTKSKERIHADRKYRFYLQK